jgi:two-component sensor histidine kinase
MRVAAGVPRRYPSRVQYKYPVEIFENTSAVSLNSLRHKRDSAERVLNGVRAVVLLLLAGAALAYRPELSRPLNLTNLIVIAPALAWTAAQYLIWYRRPSLPGWLAVVNPVVDVTSLTMVIAGYSLAQSAVTGLRSPIFMMYFVVLAARPVASSVRKAMFVSALVVVEYVILFAFLTARGAVPFTSSPVRAALHGQISPLDEGAKILLLIVAGIVAVYATSWAERLVVESIHESEERMRVSTRLVQAELDTLKLQLNPHFLFNALNGALALISTDPPAAEKMVSGLSDFLRMVLTTSSQQEAPLAQELDLVQRFVEIQQVRFGDRLRVRIDADEETRDALVPSLLLQPLVENAIRHGIGPRAEGGTISISAHRVANELQVEISDDGVGNGGRRSRQRSQGIGLGLVNTSTRLVHLYGEHHRFTYGNRSAGGYSVEIVIPFSTARDALRTR